jgi:hypothetical protein
MDSKVCDRCKVPFEYDLGDDWDIDDRECPTCGATYWVGLNEHCDDDGCIDRIEMELNLEEGTDMDNWETKIGKASNLGELKVLVEKAIELAGADARWNGWDTGDIFIYKNDASGKMQGWQIECEE